MTRRLLLAAFLCSGVLFGAAYTKVGGSGTTKVGGSGTSKVQAYVSPVPTPETGWWKLNENTGTSAADSTGNGNTGTLTGGASWTTGPNSTPAVTLDGTNGYIAVANEGNFDFDFGNAFSMTARIKVHTSASGVRTILNKQDPGGNQAGIDLRVDADNNFIRCFLINAGGSDIRANTNIGDFTHNVWRLVCLTYDGSATGAGIHLYVNDSVDVTGTGTITGSMLNSNPLWIGRGTSGYFYGDVDDVRVYNRALSSVEVAALYAAGAQ